MPTKSAIITGITGQDGSYLCDFLLDKEYVVHGIVRQSSNLDRSRLSHLYTDPTIYNKRLFLHYADLSDTTTLRRLLSRIEPLELYHLAGQSHVGISFTTPESTCDFTAMATLRLLEIIRDLPQPPRFFHAASSEIFGNPETLPQGEDTPHRPTSPYGVAKSFATQMTTLYRNSFGIFACNGISYNHESPRRGANFVTKKICSGAAKIKAGLIDSIEMGDLAARRDWGYAPDYVRGMWSALQHQTPDDYIFATGEQHSVKEIIEVVFAHLDLDWQEAVRSGTRHYRPSDPSNLVGNPSKAETLLNWKRTKTFHEMLIEMTDAELYSLNSGT